MEERNASLDMLRKEILELSKSEIKTILEQVEQEKARMLSGIKADAEKVRAETLRKVQAQADAIRKRLLSGVHLEVKKQILQVREETVRKIFEKVRQKLDTYRQSKEYGSFLKKLVMESALALDAGTLIAVPGEVEKSLMTRDFINGITEELKKQGKTVQITVSNETLDQGGVMIQSANGRTRFDNSFSARLRRFEDTMRMTAAKMLV